MAYKNTRFCQLFQCSNVIAGSAESVGRITYIMSLAFIKLTHLRHVLIVLACCILTFEITGVHGSSLQSTALVRSTMFSAIRDRQGRPMCISDRPDLIQAVRYKSQCLFFCQETSTCVAMNWRMESKSCELHFTSPTNYVVENDCYAFVNRKFLFSTIFEFRFCKISIYYL